jgi:hypothetical protein
MARSSSSSEGLRLAVGIGLMLTLAPGAAAHRLDEYLQATRVDVATGYVRLEIDLTPGIDVAPALIRSIDADWNDRISEGEASAYAADVIRQISLTQDGARLRLTLDRIVEFPSPGELRAGVGVIRLLAESPVVRGTGRHRLTVRNDHRPDNAVYLINALAPTSGGVTIDAQERDYAQRSFEIDYTIGLSALESALIALGALLLIAALVVARRHQQHPQRSR